MNDEARASSVLGIRETDEPTSVPIPPPTDAEEAMIREQYDRAVIVGKSASAKLHPSANGEDPICEARGRDRAPEYLPKSLAAYPPGYKDLCLYCVEEWRARQGSDPDDH